MKMIFPSIYLSNSSIKLLSDDCEPLSNIMFRLYRLYRLYRDDSLVSKIRPSCLTNTFLTEHCPKKSKIVFDNGICPASPCSTSYLGCVGCIMMIFPCIYIYKSYLCSHFYQLVYTIQKTPGQSPVNILSRLLRGGGSWKPKIGY